MKKRILSALTVVVLLLAVLASCGKEKSTSQTADIYLEMAQDYIEQSGYDSAAEILQKGLDATGNEQIAELLKEVLALQLAQGNGETSEPENTPSPPTEDPAPTSNSSEFLLCSGTWADEGIGWLAGGLILDISISDTVMSIDGTYVQAAPESRTASIHVDIDLSSIRNNYATVEFSDDGWGNAGTLAIQFSSGKLECYIQDTYYVGDQGFPIWGISEGWFSLIKNDKAHDTLFYTMDQYYELFPEEDPNHYEEQVPSYDMSKASGILASLGLTEDEFRDSCTILYGSLSYELRLSIGEQYCKATNCTTDDYIREAYSHSESTVRERLNNHHAHNGEQVMVAHNEEFLAGMLNYSRDYEGRFFHIIETSGSKFYDVYGYPYYLGTILNYNIVVYDLRDDVYYPIISDGDTFDCYGIFVGVESDGANDYLAFYMLSCEKQPRRRRNWQNQ